MLNTNHIKKSLTQLSLYHNILKLKPYKVFYDNYNNKHYVLKGLKDLLKPNWEKNFNKSFTFAIDSEENIKSHISNCSKKLLLLNNILKQNHYSLYKKSVLEFGCYNGAISMLMNKQFNTFNMCTDYTDYYILQRGEIPNKKNRKIQDDYLTTLRESYLKNINTDKNNIVFANDDITHSKLKSNSFDFIFSFETLEHVTQPKNMFYEIHRLLKPGGYTYHHYNPFFSLIGGHSYSTTDILYGHVLLNEKDLNKYFSQFRPNEKKLALSFYKHNLNRLTVYELKHYLKSFFNNYKIYYYKNYFLKSLINTRILKIAKNIYPSIQINDFIIDEIIIIAQK